MRIRKRSAVIALLAAALAVGVYAIAAAAPIPKGTGSKCSTNAGQPTPSNTSCLNFQFLPKTLLPTTFTNGKGKAGSIEVRVNTTYANPNNTALGGFSSQVQLSFDSDIAIVPGTLPTCAKNQVSGKTPKDAMLACGPTGPNNAWLSPSTSNVFNGFAHTNGGLNACVLAFNGPKDTAGNPTVTLYTRLYTLGGSPCPNPRNDISAGTTIPLKGTLTNTTAPFGKKLNVTGIPTAGDGLNDFDAKLQRGSYVSAKCSGHNGTINGSRYWKAKTQWTYSGTKPANGQPDDVANATETCSN